MKKEIELVQKRSPRIKQFLQDDGIIRAEIYDSDIHYFCNGEYEEIDNSLVEKNGYYVNKKNDFKVYFCKDSSSDLITIENDNHYLSMYLTDNRGVLVKVKDNLGNKLNQKLEYENILNNVDFVYKILPTKIKEEIIIKNRDAIKEKIHFVINTDLDLDIIDNKVISAKYQSKEVFSIQVPYMVDGDNNICDNLKYELIKTNNSYELVLLLDIPWLEEDIRKYPIVVDPTITNTRQGTGVYDTYIYPGDTNISRGDKEFLIAGVTRNNNVDTVNRTLIKFDLPVIGTGSQVVDARLILVDYPVNDLANSYIPTTIVAHRLTSDWDENTANWNNMSSNYDSVVETCSPAYRSYLEYNGTLHAKYENINITNIVKKWYQNLANYGLMIKASNETYQNDFCPMFFSKNNSVVGANPQPTIVISYRNQNGLEDYYDYREHNFRNGTTYVNTYNGNLVSQFDLLTTSNKKTPISLKAIYNTNDVILSRQYGCGLGWKFNYFQTVTKTIIDDEDYCEYFDADGTIHYFKKNIEESDSYNIYDDEDGLFLKIEERTDKFILKNKLGEEFIFSIIGGIGYLTKCINILGAETYITYDNNQRLISVSNSDNNSISLQYDIDSVIITGGTETEIVLNTGKLIQIVKESGTTSFIYNSNNIISRIIDENGLSVGYSYYEFIPYRVSRVTEYGLNNSEGKYISFDYSFESTTITNNKGEGVTIVYNSLGTLSNICHYAHQDSLKDAYGIRNLYGFWESSVNRKIEDGIPFKFVNNYFRNISFENDVDDFTKTQNIVTEFSTDYSVEGYRSLKVTNSAANEYIYKDFNLVKGQYYTFSAYIKGNNNTELSISYVDANNELIEEKSVLITPNDDFKRYDVTLFYPVDAISQLTVRIYSKTVGSYYLDNIQLEDGEVANLFNLCENPSFSQGFDDWVLQNQNVCQIVDLDNSGSSKALKINMSPEISSGFYKVLDVSGNAGDKFNFSFWYKNNGVVGDWVYNEIILNFGYVNMEYGSCCPMITISPNRDSWQFYNVSFTAKADYSCLVIYFDQNMDANDMYITNFCLFKDVDSNYYSYDSNGNLTNYHTAINEDTSVLYDCNNQRVRLDTPTNNSIISEYDNDITNRCLTSTLSTSLSIENSYDNRGNIISVKKYPKILQTDFSNNKLYRIRAKGTKKCIRLINGKTVLKEDVCNHDLWQIIFDDDKYKIKTIFFNNKYLTCLDNKLVATQFSNNSLFELVKNNNESFLIKLSNSNKYLNYINDELVFSELVDDDYHFQFYIEEENPSLFYEEDANYIPSTNIVDSLITDNMSIKKYEYDNESNLIKSVIDNRGNKISYEYDENNYISRMYDLNNKEINFVYTNDLLSSIVCSNKQYNFVYDEFLKLVTVKIDNIPLISYEYGNNNGDLAGITYGNNDELSIEYDSLGRIKKIVTEDDEYIYKYDSNNNLAKMSSFDSEKKYYYDLSKRLIEFCENDFSIAYEYTTNDKLLKTSYSLFQMEGCRINEYDDNETLINTDFGDFEINYEYDSLGRMLKEKIGNIIFREMGYINNGKRATKIINKFNNSIGNYEYKYDKIGNIKAVYKNGLITREYFYDNYSELVMEKNYENSIIYKYTYDLEGNIITKCEYDLNNYNLVNKIKYKYENAAWKDELTEYDGNNITYDSIGNVTSIGNSVFLNWQNGKELSSISFNNNIVSYKYNESNFRIRKTINNDVINYYLENNRIIFEKHLNYCLNYLYDSFGELFGFKYNNTLYYYIKNFHNDIVGIMDSNMNLVGEYKYDSWGKVVAVTDNLGNFVSENVNNILNINPFRYRSYYYDVETKLYYLNNRYYNPEWGRFISADNVIGVSNNLIHYNLFAYVGNNPINCIDESGSLNILKGLGNFVQKCFDYGKKAYDTVKDKATKLYKSVKKEVENLWNSLDYSVRHEDKVNSGSFGGVTISGGGRVVASDDTRRKSNMTVTQDLLFKTFEGGVKIFDVASITYSTDNELGLYVGLGKTNYSIGINFENRSLFLELSGNMYDENGVTMECFGRTDISFSTLVVVGLPVLVESGAAAFEIMAKKWMATSGVRHAVNVIRALAFGT